MSLLSAGTPMFLMGEEVGAQKAYTYDRFNENKEDLLGLRRGPGMLLFRFHQDLIRMRLTQPSLRSRDLDVIHVNDVGRVIAFRRWDESGEHLVVGSLATTPYNAPDYRISHPSLGGTEWREALNSDARCYGGDDVGNHGRTIAASGDTVSVVVPASGVVVLRRLCRERMRSRSSHPRVPCVPGR